MILLRFVATAYRRFGVTVVVDPDETARDVVVIPKMPDEIQQFHTLEIQSSTMLFSIQAKDLGDIKAGTILMYGTEKRVVQGEPVTLDPRRLEYLLNTAHYV